MSIRKKNKFIGVLTAPFRFTGKIFKAIGRFLDKDINEERLNEIKSEHLYLMARDFNSQHKGF